MTERNRYAKRSLTKNRPLRSASSNAAKNRYLPLIIIGSALVVIAVIVGVLVFAPSKNAKTDPMDKSQGPKDAKVVVTEYGDFQCPACKEFALNITPKIKTDFVDKGLIRFQFRQMAFIGEESQLAAESAECANDQGHFWDYYEKLYANQGGENVGTFTVDSLSGYAQDLKLDVNKFKSCLTSHKYANKVKQETTDGENAGVTSTPSIAINGQLVDWGGDYPKLKTVLDQAVASNK